MTKLTRSQLSLIFRYMNRAERKKLALAWKVTPRAAREYCQRTNSTDILANVRWERMVAAFTESDIERRLCEAVILDKGTKDSTGALADKQDSIELELLNNQSTTDNENLMSSTITSGKILQIIAAPANLVATYQIDGEEVDLKVVCLALNDRGEVEALDMDPHGSISKAGRADNFKHFSWR